jgi:hypothetical protein
MVVTHYWAVRWREGPSSAQRWSVSHRVQEHMDMLAVCGRLVPSYATVERYQIEVVKVPAWRCWPCWGKT